MNTSSMDGLCPIWSTPSATGRLLGRLDLLVDSPRVGGQYFVDDIAINELRTLSDRDKVKLTSWAGGTTKFWKVNSEITSASIFEAQQRKELRIGERVDGILRYLESKSPLLGIGVQIGLFRPRSDTELTEDHLIFFDFLRHSESVDFHELMSLLNYLKERRYIEHSGLRNNPRGECSLTVEGRIRLEEIENLIKLLPKFLSRCGLTIRWMKFGRKAFGQQSLKQDSNQCGSTERSI